MESIGMAWEQYGALGALGVALTLSVGFFKGKVSPHLPKRYQWQAWAPWLRWSVVFSTAGIGATITSHLADLAWPASIGLGVNAGFIAIGIRESKRALSPKENRERALRLKRG